MALPMQPDPLPAGTAVAVVVATRDRPQLLRRCLEAVAAQLHAPAELVVVDDASNPPAAEVARRFEGRLPLRVLRNPTPLGPGRARNAGWRSVSSPWVAITDDDCRPDPSWIGALADAAAEDVVVVGRTVPDPEDGPVQSVLDRTMWIEDHNGRFSTCNILYPRAVLERLGGFDPDFDLYGEDTDLGQRAQATGIHAVFAPQALVYHAVHHQGMIDAVLERRRSGEITRLALRHPHLRAEIWDGRFWKPEHRAALVAFLGCVAAPLLPAALIAVEPWIDQAKVRIDLHTDRYPWMSRSERRRELAALALIDLVEIASCIWGSVRHRTLLI